MQNAQKQLPKIENKSYGKNRTYVQNYTPMWQIWKIYLNLWGHDCKN